MLPRYLWIEFKELFIGFDVGIDASDCLKWIIKGNRYYVLFDVVRYGYVGPSS